MNQKRYPTVFPTVDVVIEHSGKLLLGRKAHQEKFRFVGGFADPALDNSYEESARREAKEETSLEVTSVKYLGSTRIDDPRYRGTPDCIITHLFYAKEWEGTPTASDDIAELKWFPREEVTVDTFVEEHKVLWEMFLRVGE